MKARLSKTLRLRLGYLQNKFPCNNVLFLCSLAKFLDNVGHIYVGFLDARVILAKCQSPLLKNRKYCSKKSF